MSIGLIIFSRYDSNRLPGKALVDISGRCLIGRVLDRSRKVTNVSSVIIATSDRPVDDPIAAFAEMERAELYRGSFKDLIARSIGACERYNLESFARVCGDRPFFDPKLVSKLITIKKSGHCDIVTTMFPRTYPPGLTTEIVSLSALKKAFNSPLSDYEREHLTPHFYRESQNYTIHNVSPEHSDAFDGLRLVVDNNVDLARARWIACNVTANDSVDDEMQQIYTLARQWDNLHSA